VGLDVNRYSILQGH